jgi:hypothetical protein
MREHLTTDAIPEHVVFNECCRGMKTGNDKNRDTKKFMHLSASPPM